MIHRILLLLIALSLSFSAIGQLQNPDEFFGYAMGEEFHFHHKVVEYYKHVSDNSELFDLKSYGKTTEGRDLIYGIVASKENMGKIEAIRLNNLKATGLEPGTAEEIDAPAIIWLSYNVHGNESAGTNAAPQVLYELVNSKNPDTQKWLEEVVVILDPCINPDGYNRYANWYKQARNKTPNTNAISREHNEPWPAGRTNHYLFDLNRDWAWLTQIESQQRLKVYQEWMPHVHVDFHEMGFNSPYYFAPAAKPYHKYITDFQGDFQVAIGKTNAKYFDKENWLYYTKEIFDLFYPSYGDTYPTFNGAIGMTYEQGGSGRAGLAVESNTGEIVSLKNRSLHHFTTSMGTIEASYRGRKELVKSFGAYFKDFAATPQGKYKTYLIKGTNEASKMQALCALLDAHKIQYGTAKGGVTGFDYTSRRSVRYTIKDKDLIIPANQPKSVLTQVLFDPDAVLSDSLTYDITAWSLPYAYGLEAIALSQTTSIKKGYNFAKATWKKQAKPYAYAFNWKGLNDVKLLGDLMEAGIKVRGAQMPFISGGQSFQRGAVILTRTDNPNLDDSKIQRLAAKHNKTIQALSTGFSTSGPDIGSGSMAYLEMPKVAIIGGEGVSVNDFGQAWHYFEAHIDYPVAVINASQVSRAKLSDFNVIVMPSGSYSNIKPSVYTKLSNWVSAGGRLIAIDRAVAKLEGKPGFNIKKKAKASKKNTLLKVYAEQERAETSDRIPGAIYKLRMDNTHPLAFGMPSHYFSLKTSNAAYPYSDKMWNVGSIDNKPEPIGFVGSNVKQKMKKTTVFAVQNKGRGKVIYMVDNPLFRGFWHQGLFLFGNAIFQVQ